MSMVQILFCLKKHQLERASWRTLQSILSCIKGQWDFLNYKKWEKIAGNEKKNCISASKSEKTFLKSNFSSNSHKFFGI